MRRLRTVLIGLACVCLVVGYYYYLSNKDASETADVTEVQKVVLKDLSGSSYPPTPREVIKFYNRILCCYYNEDYTDEEFKQLADQALLLMDAELADNNPAQQYYMQVESEVENYRSNKRKINNASVCDSNEVEYATIGGEECARVAASYFVRDNGGFTKSNQDYVLRKDSEGKWKILAFDLQEGADAKNE